MGKLAVGKILWAKMSPLSLERYFLIALMLIQICLQGELRRRRIGGVVVGIERYVLLACADLVRLTTCLTKLSQRNVFR